MTETFAVFVQAEIPQDSAEITFVLPGMTANMVLFSLHSLWSASVPSTTALWIGKFPSIPTSHSDESDIS